MLTVISSSLTRMCVLVSIAFACLGGAVDGYAQQAQKQKKSTQTEKKAPQQPTQSEAEPLFDSTGQVTEAGFPIIETQAQYAYILDARTGAVLLNKNGDTRMFPSSMTKMMTSHIVFEKLQKGNLRLDDVFSVSENAWRKQGSKMFVELNGRVAVSDLLRGVIVSSGNDACIVLAEGLFGTEEAFADEMNRKAKDIGMTNTNFRNATGWPDPDHVTTPRDLALLALNTIEKFPEYYPLYAEKEFTYHGIKQGNRNPLLYTGSGADGLKTGHTEVAGYGLTASVLRGERRLIMVVNGLPSMKARTQESQRLMDWAYREFENYPLFKEGETIAQGDVFLGSEKFVPLTTVGASAVTLARRARKDMTVKLVYQSPIPAPIQKGALLGKLVVTAPGAPPAELPVVAGTDVPRLGFFGRIFVGIVSLFGRSR